MTFHEEKFLGLDKGSRFVIALPGIDPVRTNNDPVGAETKSMGVTNAQIGANDANEVLPTLQLPLSPTSRAISTTIDNFRRELWHTVLIICK